MCVCLAPARLSNTILYVGEAMRVGKCVHVLGYQNTAQNLATAVPSKPQSLDPKLWSQIVQQGSKPAGNAMILPFPAAAPMGKDNVVDTKACKNILKDIAEAVKPKSKGMRGFGADSFGVAFSAPVEVFDTGIYTVVLARDPRDIPAALEQVPIEKRPDLKPEIFEAYAKWYPGWQVALCCFSNEEAIEADPLLWWYEPAFPNVYFAPTLDSHSGGVPDLEAEVELDHTVAVGSSGGKGEEIEYGDVLPPDVKGLLPSRGVGREFSQPMGNGDFLFFKSDAASGMFRPQRIKPGSTPAITL